MGRDYTVPLWLLKFGVLLNAYFLLNTPAVGDPSVLWPARVFFVVSAFRCLFPVHYEHNVVFHDSLFSSIFLTRLLATFAEVAYIFQFSHVLRVLDAEHTLFVDALAWLMVVQVVISQTLVWTAILTGRLALYFYEELGWALIFAANTVASAYLLIRGGVPASHLILLQVSVVFGVAYLPWQFLHLRLLRANAESSPGAQASQGLRNAIRIRNRRTDAESWGGLVGLSWMIGYWATLIPGWVFAIVLILGR